VARVRGAGSGLLRCALGGVPLALANPPLHLLRQLGAVGDRDGVAGSSPIGRGFAWFGVFGGGGGGFGGGVGRVRAPTATRALSSSNGDARGGGSITDKLAAKRLVRDPTRGAGEGERVAGGTARGGRGGSGAGARSDGRGGGGGRRGGDGGGGMGRAIALNKRIVSEATPEGLLRLVADELPNFNDVNVATAFSMFNKLCRCRRFRVTSRRTTGFVG